MKDILTKFLYSFILFLIILYIWQPSVMMFFILFDGIGLLVFLKYGRGYNSYFWKSMFIISLAGILAFLYAKICNGSSWRQITSYEIVLVLIAGMEMMFAGIIIGYQRIAPVGKRQDGMNEPELMKLRHYDLIRLKEYIHKHQIVGINGAWGSGKSFLVQKMYEESDFREEFEVIPIDLLAVHLEEIEKILVRNLDDIMEKYGIFSGISAKLQSLLGKYHLIDHLKALFFQDGSIVSSAFQKYKEDIDKMPPDKKVLIVFDDIDRIVSKETIMKIFALSEKFSSERIHILYQFGYEYLEKKDFDRKELEKFIPYVVTLSDVPYRDMVEHLWEECNMDSTGLKKDKVRFLEQGEIYSYRMNKMLKQKINLSFIFERMPVRSVKIFLNELETMISENPFYQVEENRDILMNVLFVKNFLHEYFEQLQMGKEIADVLLFQTDDGDKTIHELIREVQQDEEEEAFRKIIHANKETYYILTLLEYDFFIPDAQKGREEFADMDTVIIKRRQKNEKINHIAWNVLGNGFSEYSDMEQAAEALCTEVLTDDRSQWRENWEELGEKSYVQDLYKNNSGIIMFGIDQYLPFFQAMRIKLKVSERQWRRWIEFYFDQVGKDGITVEMIECLNYCDFTKGADLYLDTIRYFNECSIRGNFNGKNCFLTFLSAFIPPVIYLGYSHSPYFEEWKYQFSGWEEETADFLKTELEGGVRTLKKEAEEALIPQFAEEIELIIRFIEKCMKILDAENTVAARELRITMSEPRTVHQHQEEVDQLLAMLKEAQGKGTEGMEEFLALLEEKYAERKITPSEYQAIRNQYGRG